MRLGGGANILEDDEDDDDDDDDEAEDAAAAAAAVGDICGSSNLRLCEPEEASPPTGSSRGSFLGPIGGLPGPRAALLSPRVLLRLLLLVLRATLRVRDGLTADEAVCPPLPKPPLLLPLLELE